MEMPMIVLHGPDTESLLTAAYRLVLTQVDQACSLDLEKGWRPKEIEDVQLPASEWGVGRRVVVDRRYHLRTGALLVRVPDPTISNASVKGKEKDEDEGDALICHAGAAHVARCAGVFEVIKYFANSWGVDMKRRIVILHLACRMPEQYQGALRKLAEDSHASTLFVLTSTRPFSLDHGIHSRAVYVPIPNDSPPVTNTFDPLATALKMLSVSNSNASNASNAHDILHACATIDHSVARIRSLGGDIVSARTSGTKLLNQFVKSNRR